VLRSWSTCQLKVCALQLEHLSTAVIPPVMSAMVLVHLIAAQFDTSMTRNNVAHMPISFELNDDEVSDGKRKVYI